MFVRSRELFYTRERQRDHWGRLLCLSAASRNSWCVCVVVAGKDTETGSTCTPVVALTGALVAVSCWAVTVWLLTVDCVWLLVDSVYVSVTFCENIYKHTYIQIFLYKYWYIYIYINIRKYTNITTTSDCDLSNMWK